MTATLLKNATFRGQLLAIVGANLLLCWLAYTGPDLLIGNWRSALTDWTSALPSSLGLIAIGALNGQIDHLGKARIVFLKWKDPLPASQAFSVLMATDSRIDVKRLTAKHGPFPSEPTEQNAAWYKLYRTVAGRLEVSHIHRDYLLNRDIAVLALMLLIVVPGISIFFSSKTAAILALIYSLEFLVFRRAAAVYGRRFVTTVLAIKSTA